MCTGCMGYAIHTCVVQQVRIEVGQLSLIAPFRTQWEAECRTRGISCCHSLGLSYNLLESSEEAKSKMGILLKEDKKLLQLVVENQVVRTDISHLSQRLEHLGSTKSRENSKLRRARWPKCGETL